MGDLSRDFVDNDYLIRCSLEKMKLFLTKQDPERSLYLVRSGLSCHTAQVILILAHRIFMPLHVNKLINTM